MQCRDLLLVICTGVYIFVGSSGSGGDEPQDSRGFMIKSITRLVLEEACTNAELWRSSSSLNVPVYIRTHLDPG